MATAAPVYEERRMSVGRVFQRAISAITFNPVVVLGLALIVGAVPGLIMTYLFVQMGVGSPTALQTGAISFRGFIGMTFVSGLITMVISALVQAALTRATVSAIDGRRVTFGESLSSALRVVVPLIGLSLLFALGLMLGFVLLIVPGVILMVVWAVAVPSLVIEREGVFAAFGHSVQLTKGARWKILGLFLVLGVTYWLLSIVLGLVGLKMYGATTAAGLGIGNLLGSIIIQTIFNMLWGTIQPALYVELRQWKEGDSMTNLEQVFA